MSEQVIAVWHDEMGAEADHAWIVSLDRVTDAGENITSHTLDVVDTQEEAAKVARREAEKRGLRLIAGLPSRPI